jgi:hypothetical protein
VDRSWKALLVGLSMMGPILAAGSLAEGAACVGRGSPSPAIATSPKRSDEVFAARSVVIAQQQAQQRAAFGEAARQLQEQAHEESLAREADHRARPPAHPRPAHAAAAPPPLAPPSNPQPSNEKPPA